MERVYKEKAKKQESACGGARAARWSGAQRGQKRANKKNGRKGGLVKSRKKTIAARRNARRPLPGRRKQI